MIQERVTKVATSKTGISMDNSDHIPPGANQPFRLTGQSKVDAMPKLWRQQRLFIFRLVVDPVVAQLAKTRSTSHARRHVHVKRDI